MRRRLFLVGPTASGKTAVAIEIAQRLPVEIVSLDSMGVYRGMNVGTAKPSPEQRAQVPHHLLDVAEPTEPFSVGRYVLEAQRVTEEIDSRGRRALFVGGTPLYLMAMVRGLFDGPSADPELRARLEQRADAEGLVALHEELRTVDPAAATRIHPNDRRRIIRALEVFGKTGQPLSLRQTQWSQRPSPQDLAIAGLTLDRVALYRRIDARVERMFDAGLVAEVRGLLQKYGRLGREATQALGYKEVLAYLSGRSDLAETVRLVQRNTRRMAKRQLTWFRKFSEIRWFPMDESQSPTGVAEEIVAFYQQEPDP